MNNQQIITRSRYDPELDLKAADAETTAKLVFQNKCYSPICVDPDFTGSTKRGEGDGKLTCICTDGKKYDLGIEVDKRLDEPHATSGRLNYELTVWGSWAPYPPEKSFDYVNQQMRRTSARADVVWGLDNSLQYCWFSTSYHIKMFADMGQIKADWYSDGHGNKHWEQRVFLHRDYVMFCQLVRNGTDVTLVDLNMNLRNREGRTPKPYGKFWPGLNSLWVAPGDREPNGKAKKHTYIDFDFAPNMLFKGGPMA